MCCWSCSDTESTILSTEMSQGFRMYPRHSFGQAGSIDSLSLHEARAFFESFVSQVPSRIALVCHHSHVEYVDMMHLDASAAFNIIDQWLFRLYLEHIRGKCSIDDIINKHNVILSFGDACLDSVILCAEKIRADRCGLQWMLHRRKSSDDAYNKPVLSGFRGGLVYDPFRLASTMVAKYLAGNGADAAVGQLHTFWNTVALEHA